MTSSQLCWNLPRVNRKMAKRPRLTLDSYLCKESSAATKEDSVTATATECEDTATASATTSSSGTATASA